MTDEPVYMQEPEGFYQRVVSNLPKTRKTRKKGGPGYETIKEVDLHPDPPKRETCTVCGYENMWADLPGQRCLQCGASIDDDHTGHPDTGFPYAITPNDLQQLEMAAGKFATGLDRCVTCGSDNVECVWRDLAEAYDCTCQDCGARYRTATASLSALGVEPNKPPGHNGYSGKPIGTEIGAAEMDRFWMEGHKQADGSPESMVSWLVVHGIDEDDARMEVSNYMRWGLEGMADTPRHYIQEWLDDDRGPMDADSVYAAQAKTAGAQDFHDVAEGATAQEAFTKARDQAAWEYGHGGYTGTIAEKDGFVEFQPPAGMTVSAFIQAIEGSWSTPSDDPVVRRASEVYEDKWGPAVAIPSGPNQWTFIGIASS